MILVSYITAMNCELIVVVPSIFLGSPRVTSLTYDMSSHTLTCITTGGPATTITWRKDCGVLDTNTTAFVFSQTVTDQAAATYSNTLTLPSHISGSYSCTVANSRGSHTRMLQAGSELLYKTAMMIGYTYICSYLLYFQLTVHYNYVYRSSSCCFNHRACSSPWVFSHSDM